MGFDGGCLCGSVRYSAREDFGGGHCHCLDCRRTSGTGHGSHLIVAEDGFQLQGVVKGFSKPADSGNIVTRYFCPECGSAIYSRNAAMPGLVFLRASSLDDPEVFRPQMVVYTDRAASWDRMDPALPGFARMPDAQDRPEVTRQPA